MNLRKKLSANFKNILDRLNAGDELNEITYNQLSEILLYALEIKYVSTRSYNDRELGDGCRLCGEKLVPYLTKKSPSKRMGEYVNFQTFESLAEEVSN